MTVDLKVDLKVDSMDARRAEMKVER